MYKLIAAAQQSLLLKQHVQEDVLYKHHLFGSSIEAAARPGRGEVA
jgi:hypothetical protein